MRTVTLPLPWFGFVVSTRAALGAGLGLLLASRVSPERRRTLGATLVGVGALTTVPAAWALLRGVRRGRRSVGAASDARLIGSTRYPRKGDEPF